MTMKTQNKPVVVKPRTAPRLLVCDPSANVADLPSGDVQWVASPLECLSLAAEAAPALVVIRLDWKSSQAHDILVELATVLKGNRHTRDCRLLVLLPAKQRQVIEALHRAGVDFARIIGDQTLDPPGMQTLIEALGPEDRLERLLAQLCPFLHYSRIDHRHELTVCGAYLDRMVLGGDRLHETCETASHLHCEHYLQPRKQHGEGWP